MIDYKQFKYLILIPALKAVDLYSEDAVQLLLATMAQESAFGRFPRQETNRGYGPAHGVFQMEEATYNDVVNNYIKPALKEKILNSCNMRKMPTVDETVWDLRFSCIMARIFYLRVREALPKKADIEGIWKYYKKYWNTNLGKATHEQFMSNYNRFIEKV